jgi:hypothetical protein
MNYNFTTPRETPREQRRLSRKIKSMNNAIFYACSLLASFGGWLAVTTNSMDLRGNGIVMVILFGLVAIKYSGHYSKE